MGEMKVVFVILQLCLIGFGRWVATKVERMGVGRCGRRNLRKEEW